MSDDEPIRKKTILAVASGGGHWIQLRRLRPAFEDHEVVYVTVNKSARHDVVGHRFYCIPDATRWQKLRMLRMANALLWILLRVRPDVVISTGAAPGYFALRIGRMLRARTIWLESLANAEQFSYSGRLVRPYTDLWLTQWEHLSESGKSEFAGSVI